MFFPPLASTAGLEAFYGTTATILSALIIAAVLELRALYRGLADDSGRIRFLIERMSLTALLLVTAAAAVGLLSIPAALLTESSGFWNDPDHLVDFTSMVAAVVVLLPVVHFLVLIWRPRRRESRESPSQPAAGPVTREPGPQEARGSGWALGLLLVLVAASARRSGGASKRRRIT